MNSIRDRQRGTESANSCDQLTASIGDLLVSELCSGRLGHVTSRERFARQFVLFVGIIKTVRNDTLMQAMSDAGLGD
jgi:hypothetical protein